MFPTPFLVATRNKLSFILLTKELPTIMSRTKLSICPTKFIVKLIEY